MNFARDLLSIGCKRQTDMATQRFPLFGAMHSYSIVRHVAVRPRLRAFVYGFVTVDVFLFRSTEEVFGFFIALAFTADAVKATIASEFFKAERFVHLPLVSKTMHNICILQILRKTTTSCLVRRFCCDVIACSEISIKLSCLVPAVNNLSNYKRRFRQSSDEFYVAIKCFFVVHSLVSWTSHI